VYNSVIEHLPGICNALGLFLHIKKERKGGRRKEVRKGGREEGGREEVRRKETLFLSTYDFILFISF
jgi:hypothetical protein